MNGSAALSSNWKQLQAKLKAEKSTLPADRSPVAASNSTKRKRSEAVSHYRQETGAPVKKKARRRDDTTNATKRQPTRTTITKAKMNGHTTTDTSHYSSSAAAAASTKSPPAMTTSPQTNAGLTSDLLPQLGKYIALDCEMVGTGPTTPPSAQISVLARCSLVTYHGAQLYDSYVLPLPSQLPITDYRTNVSGITPGCMKIARPFHEVQAQVAELLRGRVLVGHSVQHDLRVLGLLGHHPKRDVRDTARYGKYRDEVAGGGWPRLRDLASRYLGLGEMEGFQSGEHSSVEDARVTMMLFRREKEGIEREVARRYGVSRGSRGGKGVVERREVTTAAAGLSQGAATSSPATNGDGDELEDEDVDDDHENGGVTVGETLQQSAAPRKKKSKKKKKRK